MKPRQLSDNDQSVLSALGQAEKPLSAYDILDRARSEALKAPVQVYRALEKLEDRGLVHRIEALNAFVACSEHDEACRGHEHRHAAHRPGFVICRDCGTVREFEEERVSGIAEKAAGKGFAIELVSLEVYGRCAACRARAPD
jgi:Fur family transcriptional regulator, zinc uptake regulator